MFSKFLDTVVISVDFKSQSRNSGIYPISDGHCKLFFTVPVENCLFLKQQDISSLIFLIKEKFRLKKG